MFLLSACCLIFTLNTYSQNGQHYDKFKLGLGAGYIFGKPAGYHGYTSDGDQFTTSGFILTLEPAYRVRDNIAAGLRLEVEVYPGDPAPAVLASVTINGQYYFSDEQFRPFVGVGLGIFATREKKPITRILDFIPGSVLIGDISLLHWNLISFRVLHPAMTSSLTPPKSQVHTTSALELVDFSLAVKNSFDFHRKIVNRY